MQDQKVWCSVPTAGNTEGFLYTQRFSEVNLSTFIINCFIKISHSLFRRLKRNLHEKRAT